MKTADEPQVAYDPRYEDHSCCHHVGAAGAVLADRNRELLELKGPCSNGSCCLHYAHSGPCDTRP